MVNQNPAKRRTSRRYESSLPHRTAAGGATRGNAVRRSNHRDPTAEAMGHQLVGTLRQPSGRQIEAVQSTVV